MMSLHLPSTEIDLIANWIDRMLTQETDDNGLLRDESPQASGRLTVAARELIRGLRKETKFLRAVLER